MAAQSQDRAVFLEGGHRSGATCPKLPHLPTAGALEIGTSRFTENKAKVVPAASLTGELKVLYFF